MDGKRSFNLQDTLKFALLQILRDTATPANLSVNGYELSPWAGWQGHGEPWEQAGPPWRAGAASEVAVPLPVAGNWSCGFGP